MENLEQITRLVCNIAREAGSYINKERASFSLEKVERKHAHDYVSYVDKGSEKMIVSRLREIMPEAGFITEEGTTKDDVSTINHQPSDFFWVVDPLDGTTNFIHGFAPYLFEEQENDRTSEQRAARLPDIQDESLSQKRKDQKAGCRLN